MESRAKLLEDGIQELVKQCAEIEKSIKKETNYSKADTVALAKAHRHAPTKPTNLRTSKLAEPQSSSPKDEGSWVQQIVLGCWTTLLADAARAKWKASSSSVVLQPSRARCRTS